MSLVPSYRHNTLNIDLQRKVSLALASDRSLTSQLQDTTGKESEERVKKKRKKECKRNLSFFLKKAGVKMMGVV